MAILGRLLKRGISLRESLEQDYSTPHQLQKAELRKLLIQGRETYFGRYHYFKTILNGFKDQDEHLYYQFFKSNVPIHHYESISQEWWCKSRQGIKDVCWPGKIKYYALSSGTSDASSKYIPVTKEMIKSIQKASTRQILSLSKYNLNPSFFEKGVLMVGGSTDLKYSGQYYEGDLSGITTGQIPFWFQHFSKPGKKIAKAQNWEQKLNEMVDSAQEWDIGAVVGVPAWIQLLFERIIDRYSLKNIHDIWPNLEVFVHGGVPFEPYRHGFEKLLNQPLIYIETYLASEGFIGFQDKPNSSSMRMILNNGIFYEFVPFNDENFDANGRLQDSAKAMKIDEVKDGEEYALLFSTNAGAWRYLIGDVIKFTSVAEAEIVITGRTKHFLSLCGEHLSVDNMNRAIEKTAKILNISIKEFAVTGLTEGGVFGHHWYVGSDDLVDNDVFKRRLDEQLMSLNDDYKVERKHALKYLNLEILPNQHFYDWMKSQGNLGGQNKFPRVLKGEKLVSWKSFIQQTVLKS